MDDSPKCKNCGGRGRIFVAPCSIDLQTTSLGIYAYSGRLPHLVLLYCESCNGSGRIAGDPYR